MASSSKSQNTQSGDPIENAKEIIELFGGIRPMASKMDVAVTTVQGWKKRNVIPANRRDELVAAATQHDIDLGNFVEDKKVASAADKPKAETPAAPKSESAQASSSSSSSSSSQRQANENDPARRVVSPRGAEAAKAAPAKAAPTKSGASKSAAASASTGGASGRTSAAASASKLGTAPSGQSKTANNTQAELKAMADRAMKRNMAVSGSLVVIALVVGFFMFSGDDVTRVRDDISNLQNNVNDLEGRTSFLEGMIPENLREDMTQMKEDAKVLGQQVEGLAGQVGTMAKTLSDSSQGSLMDRISMLEQQIGNAANGDSIAQLMSRIDSMSQTMQGQQQLSAAMQQLSEVVNGMQGQMGEMDEALEGVKKSNAELSKAVEGVSNEDMKAAAMLLALGQVRSSLNRTSPFSDDLKILQSVIGEDDPELMAAIDRLAPYAETGVLSADNLSEEFKAISGDILMAQMMGEDVSFQDQALNRLNEVMTLTKNGEPVTGMEEEATIARAQQHLEDGNVQAAMKELSSLEGDAAEAAQPFMQQAQGTVAAQNLEAVILEQVLQQVQGLGVNGLFDPSALNQFIIPQSGGSSGDEIQVDPVSGAIIIK